MKKLLLILLLLSAAANGGFALYVKGLKVQQQRALDGMQTALTAAQQAAQTAQADLAAMQKDAPTRDALAKSLLACQQGKFDGEYEAWPVFLRPNCNGEVDAVRRWILSGVKDLNSVNVLSYDVPRLSSVDKMWRLTVRVFGKRNSGEYGVNKVEFVFTPKGILDTTKETVEF